MATTLIPRYDGPIVADPQELRTFTRELLVDFQGDCDKASEVADLAYYEGGATIAEAILRYMLGLGPNLDRKPSGAGEYACAECGTTEAQTYVVTTLDPENPRESRTEVCLSCHEKRVTL